MPTAESGSPAVGAFCTFRCNKRCETRSEDWLQSGREGDSPALFLDSGYLRRAFAGLLKNANRMPHPPLSLPFLWKFFMFSAMCSPLTPKHHQPTVSVMLRVIIEAPPLGFISATFDSSSDGSRCKCVFRHTSNWLTLWPVRFA